MVILYLPLGKPRLLLAPNPKPLLACPSPSTSALWWLQEFVISAPSPPALSLWFHIARVHCLLS